MKVETERDRIRTVAQRWRAAYGNASRMGVNWPLRHVGGELDKLNLETATAEQVNAVIGNDSWTTERCSECGQCTSWTVMVGQEPDYESCTAWLCKSCALKLVDLIKTEAA